MIQDTEIMVSLAGLVPGEGKKTQLSSWGGRHGEGLLKSSKSFPTQSGFQIEGWFPGSQCWQRRHHVPVTGAVDGLWFPSPSSRGQAGEAS